MCIKLLGRVSAARPAIDAIGHFRADVATGYSEFERNYNYDSAIRMIFECFDPR